MQIRYLQLKITPELAGCEVRTLLRRELCLSGTVLRRVKWLEDGILLDGRRVTVRERVCTGQSLTVRLSDPEGTAQPEARRGPLHVVWEDADLAVVDKAPGMLVHPSHGHFDDTVGNYLMGRWIAADEAAGFHPVHRLDKGTSGLLVVAKHAYGQERLKEQLHTGEFRRLYLAVCEGCPQPAQGVIDAPIAQAEGSLIAREVRPDGQSASTRYRTLAVHGGRTLLEVQLDTGRTHQIRVHMTYIGHPLTGDFLYGTEDRALITRPALHSWRLELTHPVNGARLTLEAPLPEDMKKLL